MSKLSIDEIKRKRHPAKLSLNVAKRIISERKIFNDKHWTDASVESKIHMLNMAFKIMASEACIPQKFINETTIQAHIFKYTYGEHISSRVNIFINVDKNNNFYKDCNIRITVNEKDLKNPFYTLNTALTSLYHEVIHTMQQQSLCEGENTFIYTEMQKEWKNDILNQIKSFNNSNTFTDYLTQPIESYACMQSEYFSKILFSLQSNAI